jgi:hypothetical protein
MFTYIVSWFLFIVGSMLMTNAVLDTIFQYSRSPTEKKLQITRHYFTPLMAYFFILWFLSGWYLFG